jgi:hypothetical protein
MLAKPVQLVIPGKIYFPIAPQHPGKNAQVLGDTPRQTLIGARRQIDIPSPRVLGLKVLNKYTVVGKMSDIGNN